MNACWRDRRVFVTGHTGFMGGWLCTYLMTLGAEVHGYALMPPTKPSFFDATQLGDRLSGSTIGDVRDAGALDAAVQAARPEIIFHLAAQPLVRAAHADPTETFSTNVLGTVNLLEAARRLPEISAILVVTTDKVYQNNNWHWPYRESDALGGKEPYSASKAATEVVVAAYRDSYFAGRAVGVATIRAGNIIGGGDWAANRLVPDAIRSFAEARPLVLRHPNATRPWQHVLDPLPGYLTLAERLAERPDAFSCGWNFGPSIEDCRPVEEVAARLASAWGDGASVEVEPADGIFEEKFLALDSNKAAAELGWSARWRLAMAIDMAAHWYKAHAQGADLWTLTQQQVAAFNASREAA